MVAPAAMAWASQRAVFQGFAGMVRKECPGLDGLAGIVAVSNPQQNGGPNGPLHSLPYP